MRFLSGMETEVVAAGRGEGMTITHNDLPHLHGILVLPAKIFRADGEVDWDQTRREIEFTLQCGATAVVSRAAATVTAKGPGDGRYSTGFP